MVKKIVIAGLLVSLIGCSQPIHKNKFIIAGTYLEVTSPDKRAARIVLEEFQRLNNIFNPYDANSEVSRLNRTYDKPAEVSDEMLELLKLSGQGYKMTQGAFDVSQGALYGFWKEKIKSGKISQMPPVEEVEALKSLGGMHNIKVDYEKKEVIIKKKGLKIDFSAVAKGYMVDKAIAALKRNNINNALINAGGDIYCLGYNQGRPWRVGLKDPAELGGLLETQDLLNEAVATSGNYEQFFEHSGKRYSHLIDPASGYPAANSLESVTVITANCSSADIMATGFFISGLEGIKKFLGQNPSTMRIFVLYTSNKGSHIQMFK